MQEQELFLISISIHLMLLFNVNKSGKLIPLAYFNTSNVTIQQKGQRTGWKVERNFNTSNVTIQLKYGGLRIMTI